MQKPPDPAASNGSNALAISVIVSTYNRPDALDMVLTGLAEQDYSHYEVVLADDGSTEATAALVRRHRLGRRCPLHHLWQPDEGFRKAQIHNQAILKASGRYVVFLDGDCVPRPGWLSRHAALAQRQRFVTGTKIQAVPGLHRRRAGKAAPSAPRDPQGGSMDAFDQ